MTATKKAADKPSDKVDSDQVATAPKEAAVTSTTTRTTTTENDGPDEDAVAEAIREPHATPNEELPERHETEAKRKNREEMEEKAAIIAEDEESRKDEADTVHTFGDIANPEDLDEGDAKKAADAQAESAEKRDERAHAEVDRKSEAQTTKG